MSSPASSTGRLRLHMLTDRASGSPSAYSRTRVSGVNVKPQSELCEAVVTVTSSGRSPFH